VIRHGQAGFQRPPSRAGVFPFSEAGTGHAAFFDLDGTLTTHRSSWQFLHEHFGTWSEYGEQLQGRFFAGEITYAQWCGHDAKPWVGMTRGQLVEAGRGIAYADGARETVAELRANGVTVFLLSMGLNVVVERVAGELGIETWVANELCFNGERFTGEVRVHIGWGEKGRVAQRLMRERGLPPERAVAVGDSESDLSMFAIVGKSIAVNPRDERTVQAADLVIHGSLAQLLPLILGR